MDCSVDPSVNIDRDTMDMSSDEKFAVLRSIGEECICEDELRLLLKKKASPICYIWFEPSPWMDIAQGIMKTIYVNKMVKAGCTVKILIADWFVQQNYKIGSNQNKIRTIVCYNLEMWKAAGMDLDRVELVWLSDELNHRAADYWPLAMDVSRKYTLKRMSRYCANMASYGPQILPAAEIFYPCMQVAVILCQKLQVDIWLASMDQRDIIMLTREYCEGIKRETKATIMLHSTLSNLLDPNLIEDRYFRNMRDPAQTIFMHDDEDVLNRKIMRALCPPKSAVCNPCLEYIKYVILPWFGKLEVVQKERNGSNKTFASMEELIVDYESGDLGPTDVKLAFEKGMNKILEHVSDYFSNNTGNQALMIALELQRQIESADHRKIQLQNEEIVNPGCYSAIRGGNTKLPKEEEI